MPKSTSEAFGEGVSSFFWPYTLSIIGHIVFIVATLFTPQPEMDRPPVSSVIKVSMVTMPEKKTDAKKSSDKKVASKKKTKTQSPAKKSTKKTTKKTVSKKKTKTSLKKKTFKSQKVVKTAIQQLEKRVEDTRPDSLASTLEKLKKKVGKEKHRETLTTGSAPSSDSASGKTRSPFAEKGKKTAELIDIYRVEIAFQIQKNWAFSSQLAGGNHNISASLVFKVMPDGEIKDLFFTDRSGNTYLDESAHKAIMKSNPVDPHPKGIVHPFVHVGLRFTPEGIQ